MMSVIFGFASRYLIQIGIVAAIASVALMWRSDLIEKGERKAVERIAKVEKKVAKRIRRAATKSRSNSVKGNIDPHTID